MREIGYIKITWEFQPDSWPAKFQRKTGLWWQARRIWTDHKHVPSQQLGKGLQHFPCANVNKHWQFYTVSAHS